MEEVEYGRKEWDVGEKYTEETGRGRFTVVLKGCGNIIGEVGIFRRLFKSSLHPKTNPALFRMSYSMIDEGGLYTPAVPL